MENYNTVSGGDALNDLDVENVDDLENVAPDHVTDETEIVEEDADASMIVPLFDSAETYAAVYSAVNDAIVVNQVVSDNQAISSSALDYFKGVLGNELPFVDYVVYCGESYTYTYYDQPRTAYEYCMAYGDLECSGNYFSGTADVVTIRTVGEYSVNYTNDVSISLYAPQYYSRSNLGNYSGIIAYDYIGLGILVLLGLGGLMCFLDKVFGFKWR